MTTYYVKNGGSDAADGLSDGNAWATIAKVEAATLNPGDSVLFKKGSTFSVELFTITWSGSVGSLITFGSYGTGARPIFSPPTNNGAVNCGPQSYLAITGIEFLVSGTAYAAAQLQIQNTTIDDCVFHGASGPGLVLQNDCQNVTVSNCICYDNLGWGILADTGDPEGTYTPVGIIIQDCVCYDNGTDTNSEHGIYLSPGCSGAIIRRNVCYGNASAGIKFNGVTDSEIYQNECYDNLTGITLGANPGFQAGGNLIHDNFLHSNSWTGMLMLDADEGGALNQFYHNHIVNNLTYGIYFYNHESTNTGLWKNNLLYYDESLGADKKLIITDYASIWTYQTFDYNIYWIEGESPSGLLFYDGTARTFAYWQGTLGKDANGQQADPLFLAEYTDLHLKSNSPCIEAGTPIAGHTVDHDGIPRGRGINPDVGCYETLKGGPRGL